MFSSLTRLLFDSTPAEFRSAYGLAESIERLRAATKRSVFSTLAETAAVGKVTEEAVRLQRVIPMVGNSFKPFFIGRFEERSDGTVLLGKFTMLPLVKVFMSFWFGMIFLFAMGAMLGGSKVTGPHTVLFRLQPLLMVAAGAAMIAFGKWLARNDAAWLSALIERTLAAPCGGETVHSELPSNIDAQRIPTQLKCASLVLAVSGGVALVSGLTETRRWNVIFASLVMALALGIWTRRPWAWWCGFLLLGFSVCLPYDSVPSGMRIVFAIASIVVTGIWGRWWYAQRKHFR